jgi:hypothetical protein
VGAVPAGPAAPGDLQRPAVRPALPVSPRVRAPGGPSDVTGAPGGGRGDTGHRLP